MTPFLKTFKEKIGVMWSYQAIIDAAKTSGTFDFIRSTRVYTVQASGKAAVFVEIEFKSNDVPRQKRLEFVVCPPKRTVPRKTVKSTVRMGATSIHDGWTETFDRPTDEGFHSVTWVLSTVEVSQGDKSKNFNRSTDPFTHLMMSQRLEE